LATNIESRCAKGVVIWKWCIVDDVDRAFPIGPAVISDDARSRRQRQRLSATATAPLGDSDNSAPRDLA
jgi:hypothetical protein